MTTAVALAVAAVVVANPVRAPRADIRIPAMALSAGSGDSLGMLDEDFLKAIAPPPRESTDPVGIFRDLIRSLAADVTYLGKNVILQAFLAGATAATLPELTAVSHLYLPPSVAPTAPVQVPDTSAGVNPVLPEASLGPVIASSAAALNDLVVVVTEAAETVISDIGYAADARFITAAFAAGFSQAARAGALADNTLQRLLDADGREALETALTGIPTPSTIVNAARAFVEQSLPPRPAVVQPAIDPAGDGSLATDSDLSTPVLAPAPDQGRRHRGPAALDRVVLTPGPAAGALSDLGGPGPKDASAVGDAEARVGRTLSPALRAARSSPSRDTATAGRRTGRAGTAADRPGGL